ncbi:MAG: bifunctional glutamate N-acetyltransferase/amino-acid acetyltransferase ArgJ [Hahellaceae bacterium]|nr:bifunctional glutamate N-acetyltransferase/amino-acid acetyltransferase ArgJ [Hahellaceae bacterium]MCP5210813.1 bifunctional glutamate N-acetyltransferase/amino-acid acetyltransferase ArgJ [Hahellaceae bacterium]
MAVGISKLPEFTPVKGLRIGVASAGIKRVGRKDIVLMEIDCGATTSAVFTLNQFCAAPVQLSKKHLATAPTRYLLINTGNANAGTGSRGMADAQRTCNVLAEKTGVSPEAVLPFSTGVIGEYLPVDKVINALDDAIANLSDNAWALAAEGIMTTDTRPKGVSRKIELSVGTITLAGISKGAGMICPNMATMLGYIACDAKVSQAALDKILTNAVNASFNRITIDGDTSTNDSCVLIATGKAGDAEVVEGSADYALLSEAVTEAFRELAQAIVRDGEGATKFITITVEGAQTSSDALKVGYAIAHSPLVKTALFASDPNWGRILAVVGRAGLDKLDIDRVNIKLDDVCIVDKGEKSASYTEALGKAVMSKEEILIRVNLGAGDATETIWTTDLSHEYVTINAEYRT